MGKKLSTSLEENQKYFQNKLRIEKNFDIISRSTRIADRRACYYFIDGFIKEAIAEKLLEFFYSVTPEDLPASNDNTVDDPPGYCCRLSHGFPRYTARSFQ